MKEFWEEWKIVITAISAVVFIFGLSSAFVMKAQSIATSEQVEAARKDAVEVHKKDFAELSEAFRQQQVRTSKESLLQQRREVEKSIWEVEDRIRQEGTTEYLRRRLRELNQQKGEIDQGWKEIK